MSASEEDADTCSRSTESTPRHSSKHRALLAASRKPTCLPLTRAHTHLARWLDTSIQISSPRPSPPPFAGRALRGGHRMPHQQVIRKTASVTGRRARWLRLLGHSVLFLMRPCGVSPRLPVLLSLASLPSPGLPEHILIDRQIDIYIYIL